MREGLATAFAGGNPRPRDLAAGACFDVPEASARALTSVRNRAAPADWLVAAVPTETQREALCRDPGRSLRRPGLARLASAQVDCAAEQD